MEIFFSGWPLPGDHSVLRGRPGRRDPGLRDQGQRVFGPLPLSALVTRDARVPSGPRAANHPRQALRPHEVHPGQGSEGVL